MTRVTLGVMRVSALSEDERKARRKAHLATYSATPERRAKVAAYRASPEARAAKVAYEATPEVRAKAMVYRSAYRATPKGRATKVAYEATPEVRAKAAAVYAANPEKFAAMRKAAYAANPEKFAARDAAKYAANPAKYAAWARVANLRKYGLTVETYDALSQSQNDTCAICNSVCTGGRRLAVDHDHSTGKTRGLLCAGCNVSLGHLKDSPAVLSTALRYLLDHGKAFSTEDATILLDKLHHYAKD